MPFVKQGGTFIALKGRQYEEEIQEAQKAFSVLGGKLVKSMPVKLPELEDKRAVVYIKKKKQHLKYIRVKQVHQSEIQLFKI